MLATLGPSYFVLLWLTQAFCLRVTQAARLTKECFDVPNQRLYVAEFKRTKTPGHKRFLPSAAKVLKRWLKSGVTAPSVRRNAGARGLVTVKRKWSFPSDAGDYLFPSRAGASCPHLTKDTVSTAIRRVRGAFVAANKAKWPCLAWKPVRSHSGRRHAISAMQADGVTQATGMAWALIENPNVYARYTDLTPDSVLKNLVGYDKRNNVGATRPRK